MLKYHAVDLEDIARVFERRAASHIELARTAGTQKAREYHKGIAYGFDDACRTLRATTIGDAK